MLGSLGSELTLDVGYYMCTLYCAYAYLCLLRTANLEDGYHCLCKEWHLTVTNR